MGDRIYTVTVDVPNTVSDSEVAQFISDAVSSYGGSLDPKEPMFGHRKAYVKRLLDDKPNHL